MCLQAEALLDEVPLVGVLPLEVLLADEGEMVPAASVLLGRKEKIPLELVIPGEEKALLLFGVSIILWYSWQPSSSAGWTGGHRHFYFWSLPMRRYAASRVRIRKYKCNICKSGIGMDEEIP